MISGAHVYQTSQDAVGLFENFFAGFFLIKGIPLTLQILFLLLYGLGVASLAIGVARKDLKLTRLARVLFYVSFFVSFWLLVQPWDELFTNLRHSRNFAEMNTFSFNRLEHLEGTVDFLPYFVIGLLGKLGFPYLEMTLIQSLVGGFLCLRAGERLIQFWLKRDSVVVTAVLVLFPPLCINASHGFTSTTFAATILWSTYYLYCKPSLLGWGLLALLPLIRLEGAFWSLLVWGQLNGPLSLRGLARLWIFLPLLALSIFRFLYFGSPIPIPVQFKASLGDIFFTVMGLRNLGADLIASYTALALLVIGVFKGTQKMTLPFGKPLCLMAVFVLPYYLSGGDWFPSYWARYLLPFSLFSFFAALFCFLFALSSEPKSRTAILSTALVVFLLHSIPRYSSFGRLTEDLFLQRKTLAKLDFNISQKGHYRLHHLAQIGRHLEKTTSPSERIATSEEATIGFFSKREVLDFLGLINPEIAHESLRQTPSLWRQNPPSFELPFLIFKRVKPEILDREKPPYLYTFDFLLADLLEDVEFDEITTAELKRAIHRWEKNFGGLIGPLYGGIDHIQSIGYEPVIVRYKNEFCTMYFVQKTALSAHLNHLKALGFQGGWQKWG